jgi:enoyl-CoA hydratase/carnithine racemase
MTSSSSELVTYARDGDVALIGLNRPAKRNAIDDAVLLAIETAVVRAQAEAKIGLIFGHGEHFSSGLDLAEHAGRSPAEGLHGSMRWHTVFDRIDRGGIPFVSALHGAVIGGGLELAAATHIRVADATAFFALPEGKRGIFVGGGGAVRIARLMGLARMTDLMLTGRVVPADEADAYNIAQYFVPAGAAKTKAMEIARQIAANAPLSNFAVINALPRIQNMSQDDGLFFESIVAALTQTSPEARQRMKDFLEKRAEPIAAAAKAKKP